MKKSMKKRAIALGLSAAMVVTSYPAALVSAEDGFVAAEIFEGGTEELTFEEEPFSEETLDGFGAEEFTGAEGFFEEEEAAADVFEAEASAVLAEDEREAVAMSIAPEQKDWYIWEQTGDDWRSNPAGFDGEYYNQFKITWADGEESYISSGVSTRGDFLKDEKGEWIAGEGHKIVWEYQKLTVELPIYVVRIGQNGSDL